MAFGLTKALRQVRIGMDFVDCWDDDNKSKFTLGTSNIKCIQTREATNEVGGFAQYKFLVEDSLMIVDRTHRFSLRKDKKEMANCFVSTTEVYIALGQEYDNLTDADGDTIDEYQCIAFSETEDPRVVKEGDAFFTEPADVLQISAECRLRGDTVELRNVQILHNTLFELNPNC